jgi:hypothetical protein
LRREENEKADVPSEKRVPPDKTQHVPGKGYYSSTAVADADTGSGCHL